MKIFVYVSLVVCLFSCAVLSFASDTEAEGFLPWAKDGMIGKKAPDFTAKDLSGKEVSLTSFGGKALLLNFWATWCPYCREERPSLNTLYRDFKEKGLVVVAVSTDRSPEKVKEYLKSVPLDFVILHDNKKEVSSLYGIYSLPVSFLIDRDGIVRYKSMGMRDWTESSSRKLIEKIL